MMYRKRKGFTLIEMIIVISILGILMALVLPKVVGVKSLATNMQCANNMKTLIQACALYVSDVGVSPTKNNKSVTAIFGSLYNTYDENKRKWALSDMKIFACPNDTGIKNPNLLRPADGWGTKLTVDSTGADAPVSPSYVILPSSSSTSTSLVVPDFSTEPDGNVFLTERSLNFHTNGCNLGFYNGSVKFYTLKTDGTEKKEVADDAKNSNFPFQMLSDGKVAGSSVYQYYNDVTGNTTPGLIIDKDVVPISTK